MARRSILSQLFRQSAGYVLESDSKRDKQVKTRGHQVLLKTLSWLQKSFKCLFCISLKFKAEANSSFQKKKILEPNFMHFVQVFCQLLSFC